MKMLRPYLILIYSLGCIATAIPDLAIALTYPVIFHSSSFLSHISYENVRYVHTSASLPEAEAKAVWIVYFVLVVIFSLLNLCGFLLGKWFIFLTQSNAKIQKRRFTFECRSDNSKESKGLRPRPHGCCLDRNFRQQG